VNSTGSKPCAGATLVDIRHTEVWGERRRIRFGPPQKTEREGGWPAAHDGMQGG
jgi:hypothetical protein